MADSSRRASFARFLVIGILSTGSVYSYIAWRFIAPAQLGSTARVVAWVVVACLYLLGPLAILVRRRPAARDWRSLVLGTFYWVGGTFLTALTLVVVRDVAWLLLAIAHAAGAVGGVDTSFTAGWIGDSNAVIAVLVAGLVAHGNYVARRTPPMRAVDVTIADLPATFDGFTIAQITDIHVGPFTKGPFLTRVCERIDAAAPDVVAVTGDLVDGSVSDLLSEVKALGTLANKRPTFYVTGNHEYYAGAVAWCDALEKLGLTVLQNQHRMIRRGDDAVAIGGVPDVSGYRFVPEHTVDVAATFAGVELDIPRVLLAHQPRAVSRIEETRVDLQLSGHTHGGQVFPFHFTIPLQQPVRAGLEKLGKTWVYVSRGTGFWGPPMRIFAPSEITLLRLRCPMPGAAG